MSHRGFTLIEMLIATVLSAVLIGAVVTVSSRLANDRARLAAHSTKDLASMTAFCEWDCHNATQVEVLGPDRIDLIGHNAIDPATLQPTFRMVSVSYQFNPKSRELVRRQRFLDEPASVNSWETVIAKKVRQISASESSANLSLHIVMDDGSVEIRWKR